MQIQDYIIALLKGWWVIVAAACIGTGIAFLYSYSQTNIYQASTTFVANTRFETNNPDDIIRGLDALAAREAVVNTYCNILESNAIAEQATARLGLERQMTRPYTVNCVVLPDSIYMVVRVEGPSPNLSADLANAIAVEGIEYINDLQEIFAVEQLDEARPNPFAVSPNHEQDLVLGAGVSIFAGVALVLGRKILMDVLDEQDISLAALNPFARSQP